MQRSHDNITLFRGRGSPRWPGDAAISDWDAVMGRQNWSTPRAHNIISLLTGATNIKCRWLLWSKDTTLQPSASNSESQPNWRSVSGAITIIAQDYKFTCRPGIHYQWSLWGCSHSLGLNVSQWLIFIFYLLEYVCGKGKHIFSDHLILFIGLIILYVDINIGDAINGLGDVITREGEVWLPGAQWWFLPLKDDPREIPRS